MAEKWHSGISMHKLPVASGFIGLVFTVGCAMIFLLGLPQLWYFVAFSAMLGIGIAIVIRMVNTFRGSHTKPLSILAEAEQSDVPPVKDGDHKERIFIRRASNQILPRDDKSRGRGVRLGRLCPCDGDLARE